MAQQIDTELAWSFAERARKMVFPGTEQYVFAVHLRAYVLRTMELKSRGADVERCTKNCKFPGLSRVSTRKQIRDN